MMYSQGVFYRKDIFNQLGIHSPKTWSELTEVIRVLETHDYQYSFSWTRDTWWGLAPFIRPFGRDLFLNHGTKSDWEDPRFKQGFKYAIHVWNDNNIVLDKDIELFVSDDKGLAAPMMIDGLWNYMEIEKRKPTLNGKWGLSPCRLRTMAKVHLI